MLAHSQCCPVSTYNLQHSMEHSELSPGATPSLNSEPFLHFSFPPSVRPPLSLEMSPARTPAIQWILPSIPPGKLGAPRRKIYAAQPGLTGQSPENIGSSGL